MLFFKGWHQHFDMFDMFLVFKMLSALFLFIAIVFEFIRLEEVRNTNYFFILSFFIKLSNLTYLSASLLRVFVNLVWLCTFFKNHFVQNMIISITISFRKEQMERRHEEISTQIVLRRNFIILYNVTFNVKCFM